MMNVLNHRTASAPRMLRKLNIASSAIAPETLALCEMLRSHIDDTVVRAQHNVNLQRTVSESVRYSPEFVYARGANDNN